MRNKDIEKIETTAKKVAFVNGWSQLRQRDVAAVRTKIMTALSITTQATFRNRLFGRIDPTLSEIVAIETIFAEYGIKSVWGSVSEPVTK
jgi:hypothetical protein